MTDTDQAKIAAALRSYLLGKKYSEESKRFAGEWLRATRAEQEIMAREHTTQLAADLAARVAQIPGLTIIERGAGGDYEEVNG